MVCAYPDEIDDSDGYGYTMWAWIAPENMIVPCEGVIAVLDLESLEVTE